MKVQRPTHLTVIRPEPPASSRDICFFRALYCGVLAVTVLVALPAYVAMYRDFAYSATPLLEPFGKDPMPFGFFLSLGIVLIITLILAALGIATRTALAISGVVYFIFFATQLGFTKPLDRPYTYHIKNLGFFILLVLAIAPGIDRHTILQRGREMIQVSSWPKVFILIGLGAAYFGSGYCKMVNDPLWVDGHTAAANILRQHIRLDIGLAYWVGQQHLANIVASVVVIFVELTFAIGIFTRLRLLYIAAGLSLHLSIYFTMGVNFIPYFCTTYFIFLRAPGPRLAKNLATPPPRLGKSTRWILGITAFALFYVPVFARWEAWPFSDYRVFTKRNHPERIAVLRYGGEKADGEFEWLEKRWQQELRRRHEKTIHQAYGRGDQAAIESTVLEAFSDLPPKIQQSYKTFGLTRRKIRPAKDPSKRWRVKDEPLYKFEVPTPE